MRTTSATPTPLRGDKTFGAGRKPPGFPRLPQSCWSRPYYCRHRNYQGPASAGFRASAAGISCTPNIGDQHCGPGFKTPLCSPLRPQRPCAPLSTVRAWDGPPDTVTIEAQREREQLRREVNQFVDATIHKPSGDESLLRWDSPVCALVAGMKREEGEHVLERLSNIARSANAPLAGENCKANLYVIVARNPSAFLQLWWRHDPRLFNTLHGAGAVKRFIGTPRAVRVWYNDYAVDPDSGSEIPVLLAQSAALGAAQHYYPVNIHHGLGSRLTYTAVRAIASVIVVVDAQKVAHLNFGQLADYVSMVSLAEVNPDKDLGAAPSILSVFSATDSVGPQGLTAWDRALLHAVYRTKQKEHTQLSQIKTATLEEIGARTSR